LGKKKKESMAENRLAKKILKEGLHSRGSVKKEEKIRNQDVKE